MERNTKAVEASRLVRPSVWVWTGDLVGHPGRTGPVSADGDGDGAELRKTAGLGCSGTAPQPPDCERTLLFQTGTRDPEGSSEPGGLFLGSKWGSRHLAASRPELPPGGMEGDPQDVRSFQTPQRVWKAQR